MRQGLRRSTAEGAFQNIGQAVVKPGSGSPSVAEGPHNETSEKGRATMFEDVEHKFDALLF